MLNARRQALLLGLACLLRDSCAFGREDEAVLAHADSAEGESEFTAIQMDAEMEHFIKRLTRHSGKDFPGYKDMADMASRKVSPKAAEKMLKGKLPHDVASMLQTTVEGGSHQPFSEDSLTKARKYLNQMMFKAWKELDDKVIQCKVYEDKMRGSMDQVKTDIARLGSQVADMERIKAEAVEEIGAKEQEILAVQQMIQKETSSYMTIYYANKREMTIRRNDLAVFEFMLKLTKCKKAAAFTQLDESQQRDSVNICESNEGLVFDFGDKAAQEKMERIMTPSARAAVRDLLGHMMTASAQNAAALLQKAAKAEKAHEDDSGDDDHDDGVTDMPQVALNVLGVSDSGDETEDKPKKSKTTTAGLPTPPVPKVKVVKRLDATVGSTRCPNVPPDCGLLHDNMSLMWGKFKDLVDELQAEMDKNQFEFDSLMENFNQQLDVLRASKAAFTIKLNEATASINADREEASEKEDELRKLMKEYKGYMRKCTVRIKWIFFQDFCGYFVVRAQIMEYSKECPPEKIVDCDVTAYLPGECSVPCDDTCPHKYNPFGCGGWQSLTREVIMRENECGVTCPELKRARKCNQFKCPVDCRVSKWSGWSKCSRDCEGGVQGRTRSVLVKPKNGGKACNTASESRPCNTGSCDRNCRLRKWSKWSPCSVACGGGFQERWRRVLIPIRGDGRCPKYKSKLRYGLRKCNSHDCRGDEVCIAKQDLVISIDSSGSLREKGFKILKDFSAGLIDRYMGMYFGYEDMKIGVVQFGNGEIKDDSSISDALLIQPLTSDMDKVKKAVEGMTYQKGFTNMAQAFGTAEKMFLLGGRRKAMSAVLTITDGKPSFLFQTYEKVMQLKDKHTKLFFAPVTQFAGTELKLMKKWASKPWETNLVHVQGLAVLKADSALFQQKMVVKFCPEAMSPSAEMAEEIEVGYMLIRENGHCGKRGAQLSTTVEGAADCAALAQGAEVKAFSLGIRFARGRCYAEDLAVTDDMIASFKKDRKNPACPGGKWEADELYDFYILMPFLEV